MNYDLLFNRNEIPFGIPWEKWASMWYEWMISIPKKENPCLDETGKYCSVNQTDKNVWFLAGTFGNIVPVKRKCSVPMQKAIFFPALVKEDSFAEDSDLKTEVELIGRSRDATDKVSHMEATIEKADDTRQIRLHTEHLRKYRVNHDASTVNLYCFFVASVMGRAV